MPTRAKRQGLLANLETSAPLTMAWQAGHHATVLTAHHLTLALPTHSLGPIDFTLKRGEQLIITGPNGCGKTSLLRYLQHAIDHHATDELSFGQQRKLALATCLLTPANLYFLDEPFDYLDLINQDQILALLKQVRPTMLIVEHDPTLIAQLGAPTLPLNN